MIGPVAPAQAQQCVSYFEKMLQGMERDGVPHAGTCAKRNKLMVSLTDLASQEFYAPGSPGARRDIQGKRAGTVVVDPNFASWSPPDFKAYLPPWQDGRWWKDGSKIVFNCQMPIPAGSLQQAESFLECARVYSCSAAAAMCGLELARTTNTNDCAAISRKCVAANPVPSGKVEDVAAAPPPNAPAAGSATSAPRTPPQAAPGQQAFQQMSPQCQAQLNRLLEGADKNDKEKASAAYGTLRAECDPQIRRAAEAAQVGLPERVLSSRAMEAMKKAMSGDPGRLAEAYADRGYDGGFDAGEVINFGFALLGLLGGVAGVYAAMPGGGYYAAGGGGNFSTLNPRARSTYGQGAPSGPAAPTNRSTITGIK